MSARSRRANGKDWAWPISTTTSIWRASGRTIELDGLGTAKFGDGTRYEGHWRDGQPTGLGVREKPGVERAAGNFVDNRLEGVGVRRQMTDPGLVQAGEFHADALDGVGVETLSGSERYEGEFRAGQRNGYGLLFGADGKGRAGRWENGKQVETAR